MKIRVQRDKLTARQNKLIRRIEEQSSTKFQGHSKAEATEFISSYLEDIKSSYWDSLEDEDWNIFHE